MTEDSWAHNQTLSTGRRNWNYQNLSTEAPETKIQTVLHLPKRYISTWAVRFYSKKWLLLLWSKTSGANSMRNKTAIMIDSSVKGTSHLFSMCQSNMFYYILLSFFPELHLKKIQLRTLWVHIEKNLLISQIC